MNIANRTGPLQQLILEHLTEQERSGANYEEMARSLDLPLQSIVQAMRKLVRRDLVAFKEEPTGTDHWRRRWYLVQYAPRQGETKKQPDGPVAAHRTGTLDNPWGAVVVAGVICAAECRPWAAAAAAR